MSKVRIFCVFPALIGLIFFYSCESNNKKNGRKEGGWVIHEDGSFDLVYGNLQLEKCYPAIDDSPIRALSVKILEAGQKSIIEYEIFGAEIKITLASESGAYTISTELYGAETAPDWIKPLAGARVRGADRFYRQGFGFAGASGVFKIPTPKERVKRAVLKEDVWSYDSYLFTGLISPGDSTLVISAYDHNKFQHRSTIYNKQHRIGLIDRHKDTNEIFFETGFATEGIDIPSGSLDLPVIYIKTGEHPFSTLHSQALEIAKFNKVELRFPPRYYYCSWYEFHDDFNSAILFDMLDGIDKMKRPVEIQTIQIDDGYAPLGDWLNVNDKFPEGLEKVVERINASDIEAGIWVGPFMVEENSFIFKDHKDWILKDTVGNLYAQNRNSYVLDTSHPEAFEYLRNVFRTFRKMGFTTYKTDFLDWGLIDSKKVTRYSPGKTSVQYFVDVIKMIDREIGEDSYWLACIAPFQQMIGHADGMRVSNDVSWRWNDETTGNMFREMYADQFFNNVLWQNDPDVLYLRDYSIQLSENEKYAIALYDGFMGGMITTSCRFPTLSEDMLDLWAFIKPSNEHVVAELPFYGQEREIIATTRDYPAGIGIFFANIQDETRSEVYNIKQLTGIPKAYCYKWYPENELIGIKENIKIDLDPHESLLLYCSEDGSLPPEFMNF